jgi:hypothetical protein
MSLKTVVGFEVLSSRRANMAGEDGRRGNREGYVEHFLNIFSKSPTTLHHFCIFTVSVVVTVTHFGYNSSDHFAG